ncbi:hypothetical protein [Halorubrum sp. Boch-26]|uniref:hypothetical protein n=1 Tax=Halorubrum sp. Boch-26 TaxID=2994426 RepID=UPI002468789B|nr:hypothetical protein [Halorubrum sp. Boch-26]
MTSTTEKVRQLAPHWAAMFLLMVAVLALVEQVVGAIGLVPSVGLVVAVGIGYPYVVRALGIAPPVWRRP